MKLAEALALVPRARAKRRHDEGDLQEQIVTWLRLVLDPKLYEVFSIPNGGKRDPREAARLKRTGTLAGVFDVEISGPGGRVFRIETKTDDGELSDAQKEFELHLIRNGSPYVVARSLRDVETAIAQWRLKTRAARAA